MKPYQPTDSKELQDIIANAIDLNTSLEIVGGASKQLIGSPICSSDDVQTQVQLLDLSNISGVIDYHPEELILTTKAATSIALLEQILNASNQKLAFDPPDFNRFLGTTKQATLGGAFATNHHGSRRLGAGPARDYLLGVSFVNGRAEDIKAGGKVVKNVTGYDVCKLLTGSWGTLGIMHEVTIKTMPLSQNEVTLWVDNVELEEAVAWMTKALNSPYNICASAYIPKQLVKSKRANKSGVFLCIEGEKNLLDHHFNALAMLFKSKQVNKIGHTESLALWQSIRDIHPFESAYDCRDIWRVHVPPAQADIAIRALEEHLDFDYYLDWSGGLIWVGVNRLKTQKEPILIDVPHLEGMSNIQQQAQIIRTTLLQKLSGHATLIRSEHKNMQDLDIFHPLDSITKALQVRIKDSFDPLRILNPGRFYKF